MYVEDNINLEKAHIIWPNFSGRKGQYNREGDRNFTVIIPNAEVANQLIEDGWNVKMRPPREEGDEPEYRLQVAVAFNGRPPKIVLVTRRKQTILDENTVGLLDTADIAYCDMTIRPYNWKREDGAHGVKAYLKTLYAVLEEDYFSDRYAQDDYPGEPPFDPD